MNRTAQRTHRSAAHLLLTAAGITGIAALFLPFASDYSPVDAALDEELRRLALPFFISILISTASARWIISGHFSRSERFIAYAASAAAAGVTLSLLVTADGWPAGVQEWISMVAPVAMLSLGVYIVTRNLRIGPCREFTPVMALQVAYLAHSALCLVAFFGEWQAGALCVGVATVAYSLQIALVSAPWGPQPVAGRGGE